MPQPSGWGLFLRCCEVNDLRRQPFTDPAPPGRDRAQNRPRAWKSYRPQRPSAIRHAGAIFQGRITSRSPILAAPGKKRVSHICVWRYVRPFVRNNHCSVCDCNRIGGFARDDSLPQHVAAISLGPHPNLANNRLASACVSRRPIIFFASFHLPGSSWPSVNSPSSRACLIDVCLPSTSGAKADIS